MLAKNIIQKILYFKDLNHGKSQTARELGISRYRVAYYCQSLKRKCSKTYMAKNDESEKKFIKSEKLRIENQLFKGNFYEDDPVGVGRTLRQAFISSYGVKPENI